MRPRRAGTFSVGLACVLAALLSACASTQAVRSEPREATEARQPGWRASDEPLSAAMRSIARQLGARAGAAPGNEAYRGFLSTGGRGTQRFELPPRTCMSLVALSSQGIHDMDAAVYGPEGELLATDSQPDAHPTIQLCNDDVPRHIYYVLQVYEGAGSFLVVPFVSPADSLETVAKLLGAQPAVARLDQAQAGNPRGRVNDFSDGLRRRGFEPVQRPLQVPLSSDQRMRVSMPVEAGYCYTAGAFALRGLDDVNLRVLDEEDFEVARDESPASDASAQFCVEEKGQYTAELHDVAGTGPALLVFYRAKSTLIGGTASLWLGERPLARASRVPLEQVMAAAGSRAAREGYRESRTLRVGRLMPGEAVAENATVPAQRCVRVVASGGAGVRMLALRAVDAQGQTLDSAQGEATTTFLHVCADEAMPVRLQLHALAGSGRFALTWHEAALASISPVAAMSDVRATLQQVERQAEDDGYTRHPRFADGPVSLSLRRAEPAVVPLELQQGRCVRAYVVSRERGAYAELVTGSKRIGTLARATTPARFCAPDRADAARAASLRIASEDADAEAWLLVLVK